MTWLNSIASNTPKPYRFKLVNPDTNESIVLTTDPIGWDSGSLEIERKIEIGGVFAKFSTGTLTFIKEGAKFLRDIWDSKEINGRCNLHIYWFKQSTRSYVEFPNSFALSFSTIKTRVKVGKHAIGVGIEAINNDTLTKLINRGKTNVDITKLVTSGGYTVVDYGEGIIHPLPKNINIPELTKSNLAGWSEYSGITSFMLGLNDQNSYTTIPLNITMSDFTGTQNIGYETRVTAISSLSPILVNTIESMDLKVLSNISVNVLENYSQDYWTVKFIATDNIFNITSEVEMRTFGKNKGLQNYFDVENITVPANGNLYFVIEVGQRYDVKAMMLTLPFISISQEVVNTAAATVEGFPIYESFERVLQHCLDSQFPFYSEFFGRQDVVYNLDGDKYLNENQLRFFSVLSGLSFRGSQLGETNNPLSIGFELLFNSFSKMLNLGYSHETIDGFDRIRVEEYSYFFDETVVLDLSSRLSIYDIESEAMPELSFQRIKTGYENFTYEVKNGRGEYNTTQHRTTIVNTDSEFDNISKIRADMTEMVKLIENPITENGSEDMESDNHIFVLKTQKDGDEWKPETNENIIIENSSSIYGDLSFNLYISPLRNLLRNGVKIKSALTKFPESVVKFQTSEKSQTLRTTGEGFTITENEDILIDEPGIGIIEDPIFKPIKHSAEVKFTFDDLVTLQSNLYGLIKFSDTIQGYLLSLKKQNNEDKAVITIIEKYV